MARKDRTPKPPRRVQAPQPRRGPSGGAGADALRRQRLLLYAIAGSGVLALAVVLGIVLLGGGSGTANAQTALTASGCTLQTVDAVTNKPDHSDVGSPEAKVKWNTFPPSNGPHYGQTIIYGSYDEPLQQQLLVHNLEHGGVSVQWGSKVPAAEVAKVRAWYSDDPDGLVLAPLPALGDKIALAAWQDPTPGKGNKGFGRVAKCTRFDEKSFDAFLDAYAFQGPEPFPRDALAPGGN
jgi:hypothetical protein